MPQFHTFGVGLGFVLHKVRVGGSTCDYSAWFRTDGTLHDAQGRRVDQKTFTPVKGGPVWTGLQAAGRAYHAKHKATV